MGQIHESAKRTKTALRDSPAAGELQAVIGEDSVDSERQAHCQSAQKPRGNCRLLPFVKFRLRKFARPVDRHEEQQPVLLRLHVGNVNVRDIVKSCGWRARILGNLLFVINNPTASWRGSKENLMKGSKIIGLAGLGKAMESSGYELEAVIRWGLRRIPGEALLEEVAEYLERHGNVVGPDGRRLVTGNGSLPERDVLTGVGPIRVKQPRVRDDREGHRFTSSILPPFLRRLPGIDALIPALYLKEISTGDFSETLQAILGPRAKGLGPTNIGRLKESWRKDHEAWEKRDLSGRRHVCWWADGVYFNVRLQKDRPCIPVLMGATGDGWKELVAVWDGQRESKLSWLTVLRDLKSRGLPEGPRVAVEGGALGFCAALEEEYPECGQQPCWVHKTVNILDRMPKSVQPDARRLIHGMYLAPKKDDAMKSYNEFVKLYGSRYPKAVGCLARDRDVLFTFHGFPAEHWIHLRTTNPVESVFAMVRHRTRGTKGCGTRLATLAMVFQLARAAEKKWRRLNGHRLLAEVISGVEFVDGERKKAAA